MTTQDSDISGRGRPAAPDDSTEARRRAGRRNVLLIALISVLPVLAAYFAYFVVAPSGRTNYGELITPQRPAGDFVLGAVEGAAGSVAPGTRIDQWRGKWIFVVAAPAGCDAGCRERLYDIRQVRLTTGQDRHRVERLWVVTDAGRPDDALLAAHAGMHLGRADATAFSRLFPAGDGGDALAHIYLIDPLGHLMMRFPANADPNLMKKDIAKLLKVSQIG